MLLEYPCIAQVSKSCILRRNHHKRGWRNNDLYQNDIMDIQKRYANHKKSVNNPRYSTETELSKHMWKLKNKERA